MAKGVNAAIAISFQFTFKVSLIYNWPWRYLTMARPYTVEEKVLNFAHSQVKSSTSVADLKRALCVSLSVDLGLDADQIASALKISRRTVFRYRDELSDISNAVLKF
jgi:hypothetical protein